MAKLASVDFEVLDAAGKNYLSWRVDLKFHLRSMALLSSILSPAPAPAAASASDKEVPAATTPPAVSDVDKAKAIIYIRRHIDRTLKAEYLTVEDPIELWNALEARYRHQIDVILPRASYEWENLRLQDYKSVAEYNSALHNITSRLKLCGEEVSERRMLEKTFTSFHEKDAILMQQYRERNFTKFSDLLSCLLRAEQNRELLLATHNLRPAGAAPLPEAHTVTPPKRRNRRRGKKNKGKEAPPAKLQPQTNDKKGKKRTNTWRRKDTKEVSTPKKDWEDKCSRCGMQGHWSRVCRTPRHLQDLYQASQKSHAETNLMEIEPPTKFNPEDFENDDLLD